MAKGNPIDTVTMDIPFLIRLMEYCREEAGSDIELHIIAEHLLGLSSKGVTATMSHVKQIFPD